MKNKSGMKTHMGDDGDAKMTYGNSRSGAKTSVIPETWPTGDSGVGKQSGKAGSVSNSGRSPWSVSRRKGKN